MARLATADAGARPHIVPVRFAEDPEGVCALSLLADRYPRFAAHGPVLAVDVRRRSGWVASGATDEG